MVLFGNDSSVLTLQSEHKRQLLRGRDELHSHLKGEKTMDDRDEDPLLQTMIDWAKEDRLEDLRKTLAHLLES